MMAGVVGRASGQSLFGRGWNWGGSVVEVEVKPRPRVLLPAQLGGLCRKDVTVQYYTFARQRWPSRWPDGFSVGYVDGGIMPWTRYSFAKKLGEAMINREANDERLSVGQEPIVTVKESLGSYY